MAMALKVISGVLSVGEIWPSKRTRPIEASRPVAPPMIAMTMLSTRIWNPEDIQRNRRPDGFSDMPISRMRSVMLASMMFMITRLPPTDRADGGDDAATHARVLDGPADVLGPEILLGLETRSPRFPLWVCIRTFVGLNWIAGSSDSTIRHPDGKGGEPRASGMLLDPAAKRNRDAHGVEARI